MDRFPLTVSRAEDHAASYNPYRPSPEALSYPDGPYPYDIDSPAEQRLRQLLLMDHHHDEDEGHDADYYPPESSRHAYGARAAQQRSLPFGDDRHHPYRQANAHAPHGGPQDSVAFPLRHPNQSSRVALRRGARRSPSADNPFHNSNSNDYDRYDHDLADDNECRLFARVNDALRGSHDAEVAEWERSLHASRRTPFTAVKSRKQRRHELYQGANAPEPDEPMLYHYSAAAGHPRTRKPDLQLKLLLSRKRAQQHEAYMRQYAHAEKKRRMEHNGRQWALRELTQRPAGSMAPPPPLPQDPGAQEELLRARTQELIALIPHTLATTSVWDDQPGCSTSLSPPPLPTAAAAAASDLDRSWMHPRMNPAMELSYMFQ